VRHAVKILTACFLILNGCVSSSFEKNNIPDRFGGDSRTMVLNYENRVRGYDNSIIDSHMRIYLEVEEPWIITVPELSEMNRIYSIAPIGGAAVYRVEIGDKGTVLSSRKVLSAGLGLDEIADDIFKQIKLEQAYLAGKPGKSTVDIKILFRADGMP